MKVDVDQMWASPSTLHLRVIVWADDRAWRHKHYVAVPLSDVPEEVGVAIVGAFMDATPEENHEQTALF